MAEEQTQQPGPPSKAREYATLIGAITAGIASIVIAVRPPPDAASSAQVASLQEKLAAAERALSDSEIGEIKKRLDSIDQRLDLWQQQRDREAAANLERDERLRLLAELTFRLNGGSPMHGFPRPGEGLWSVPNNPPPLHRTDQTWPAKAAP